MALAPVYWTCLYNFTPDSRSTEGSLFLLASSGVRMYEDGGGLGFWKDPWLCIHGELGECQ